MFCLKLIRTQINKISRPDNKGVALFIVLSAMATLAIFVGEITYTAQVNQKLAYDRLDQIKAHSLAKSGLRIALLRIRAYSELKKTIGDMAKSAGASADAVSSVVPKAVMEKIWSEPITIPFSGDIAGLPMGARDALTKFRKDSGMEGKLYISIQAQSSRFNLNSTIAAFAPSPSPNPSPTATPAGGTSTAGGAAAAGCLKGAAVGGVGGHVAGHHALLGAAVGCGVGHHMAKKQANAEQATENQAKPPVQPQSTK